MHPLVYEINTRPWLWALSEAAKRELTLAEVPEEQLEFWRELGFTHIWLMGVWRVGERAREHSLKLPELRQTVPPWADEEIAGSPYAVADYEVSPHLGGEKALRKFRERLYQYGLKLILDFVPNHLGHDHAWISERPELFVQSRVKRPDAFRPLTSPMNRNAKRTDSPLTPALSPLRGEGEDRRAASEGEPARWFAYGKDPFFPGWVDTVQLEYRNPATRVAMLEELQRVARLCDGVRCDMAMLVLNDVFASTWSHYESSFAPATTEFWAEAIGAVRREFPEFLFLAEVYWNLETRLQELGFDFTYDKRLYDHIVGRNPAAVQQHLLGASRQFLERGTHFLENHDEARIASLLSFEEHRAAALLILGLPGMCLLHEGQLTGARQRLSVHLGRRRIEPEQAEIANMYGTLLKIRQQAGIGKGKWNLLEPRPASGDNRSAANLILVQWVPRPDEFSVLVVNLSPQASQCYVDLTDIGSRAWRINNLLAGEKSTPGRWELKVDRLFLEVPGHGAQLLHFRRTGEKSSA